jgi:drug/metabolite transporter (DMT)-like permease
MWSGTALALPLLPATIRSLASAPGAATASAVYLGLLPGALGFVIWGYAVARNPVATSTAALYLVPPVALAVSFCWLGETPRPIELVGGLISIGGVIVINRSRPAPAVRSKGLEPSCPSRGPASQAGPSTYCGTSA